MTSKKADDETTFADQIENQRALSLARDIGMLAQKQRILFLSFIMETSIISENNMQEAALLLAERKVIREEQEAKQRAENEERERAMNSPESRFPVLFHRRTTDPSSLEKWLQKTSIAELQKLLTDIRNNPRPSIYHGEVTEACQTIEIAISKKMSDPPPDPPEKKRLIDKVKGYLG